VGRSALSFGAVAILHAIATGSQFGFDIMNATGLTSGTVYPTLDRLEHGGLLKSHWEAEAEAHREGRPARRYFKLTATGVTALTAALEKHRMLRPVRIDPRLLESNES
jgi:PadR family transcriptional regulator, regulatory protein PadR